MIQSSQAHRAASRFSESFWPEGHGHDQLGGPDHAPRVASQTASNLYELFVQDISLLVAGACHADRVAHVLFSTLSPRQIRLRELVLGLACSARGCLPALPPALGAEGVALPPVRDRVVSVLLRTVVPLRGGIIAAETSCMWGARAVSAFADVAQHMALTTARAAQDARLLGSDQLTHALLRWAEAWHNYLHDLRRREPTFRAQAYAAGLLDIPLQRQTA